mmetsp:Transcript_15542/g.27314  ORF Transcript_15542/g.27314 Transcript_15542/m.27314 type:complete len:89 (-) Transcript_15542:479-745(-)
MTRSNIMMAVAHRMNDQSKAYQQHQQGTLESKEESLLQRNQNLSANQPGRIEPTCPLSPVNTTDHPYSFPSSAYPRKRQTSPSSRHPS